MFVQRFTKLTFRSETCIKMRHLCAVETNYAYMLAAASAQGDKHDVASTITRQHSATQ